VGLPPVPRLRQSEVVGVVRISRTVPLQYPHPGPRTRPLPSDLHETAGLPGNWALDFMAPGGTPVYAPQDGLTVTRLSGHDPAEGVIEGDIFGWNVYLRSDAGVTYFLTHMGDRRLSTGLPLPLGMKVGRRNVIGHVGHWPDDPGRSHTHMGVTHPMGRKPAVARIEAVARAPFPRP